MAKLVRQEVTLLEKRCCQGKERPFGRGRKEVSKAIQLHFSKLCKTTKVLASRKAEVSPSRKRFHMGSPQGHKGF